MKKTQRAVWPCRIWIGLALVLSHTMCAVTAWNYCTLELRGRYAGGSAPGSAALLLVIPFGLGVAVYAGAAWYCGRRRKHVP